MITLTRGNRARGEPFQGRKTAVRHEDQLAIRQPAPHEPDALPGAFQHSVMAAAPLGIEARRGTQHRQKGKAQTRLAQAMGAAPYNQASAGHWLSPYAHARTARDPGRYLWR